MISFSARIVKKENVSANTTAVSFDIGKDFSFQAGQYITVTLPNLSDKPTAEQFRDFSITSSPEELPLITITYRDSTSLYKKTLAEMNIGDEVFIDGPKGIFTLPAEDAPLVFIAGGVGITPFISITRHLKHHPRATKPLLFYYNNSRESAVYLSELEKRQDVITFYAVFGPMTDGSLLNGDESAKTSWYVAGPPGMVKKAREVLRMIGVEDQRIKTEEFSGYERAV